MKLGITCHLRYPWKEYRKSKMKNTPSAFNPWTYTHSHPPTVVQGRGGGWMEPLPGVFDMLQYFETILSLVDSL